MKVKHYSLVGFFGEREDLHGEGTFVRDALPSATQAAVYKAVCKGCPRDRPWLPISCT